MIASSPVQDSLNKTVNTAAYYASIFVLGLFAAILGPALPTLANNTSSTIDQISLLFVLGALGYLLGSFFGGRAFDRFPGHRLLSFTLVVIAICAVFIPVVRVLWLLLLVEFVFGLAKGANDVGCNTLLLWVHKKDAGPYLNGLHFFFGVGSFISPLVLAGILSWTGNIEWAFWMFAIINLPVAVWLWFLPEPQQAAENGENVNGRVPFVPIALMVLAFVSYVGAEIGFGNWLYTYAFTLGLGTEVTAAYLTSAFWGTFTVGRLLAVWVSTRLRPMTNLVVDLLGCMGSAGMILLWPDSRAALWAGSIGLGLFMASIFPTMLVLAGERMWITGTVTGWFLFGGGTGGMILPWLVGQAFVAYGPGTMPVFILGSIVLNLLVLAVFNSRAVRSI